MPLPIRIAGILIAAGAVGPAAAAQADNVTAIIPGGPGVLTKCRGWVVASSCRTYHHISLPSRIAVGDTITVSFGSHPKEIRFYVARIDFKRQHCALFSKADGNRHRMDKINVAPCYRAGQGAVELIFEVGCAKEQGPLANQRVLPLKIYHCSVRRQQD
jgi:hypothetical protein